MLARPIDEWHEGLGDRTWWALGEDGRWLGEAAWIGSPLASDWPGYHTHFTDHPQFPETPEQTKARVCRENESWARDMGFRSW